MYKRIDYYKKDKDPQWHEYIFLVLLTYNDKTIHNSTGLTPSAARKEYNQIKAKAQMEMRAKRNRSYPELEVGDKVKIYQKRRKEFKERVPLFSDRVFEVKEIIKKENLKFYEVNGRLFQRHELLKILE